MALKQNLVLMGTSAAVRLGAGLFTFSVLARLLGPESFGVLMLWFSVAVLLSLLTNYGLTPYVLREIGAAPAAAESIINEGWTGKLVLAGGVLSGAVAAAWSFGIEPKLVFLCLLAAAVADTFSEFLNAGLRARDRFDVETRIATITSLSHAVIVAGAVFLYPTVEAAAFAYLVSRLTVLALTLPAVARHFAAPRLAGLGASFARLRRSVSYAIDFGFQNLFGQLDNVILNYFLGPAAVGIYQAGMRVFQGGIQAATVLSNVFLSRASAANATSMESFTAENHKMQVTFILVGVGLGLIMAAFPDPIVSVLFGESYLPLVELMPLFGLLFFLRFAAGAWGVVLTAAGEQAYRTKLGILFWVVAIPLAAWLVPLHGSRGWLIALCIGTGLLIVGYGMRGRLYLNTSWSTAGLSMLGGMAFLPFIWIR